MNQIICWLAGIKDSLTYKVPISGHEYIDKPSRIEGQRIYYPMVCARCGHAEEVWRDFS